MEAEVDGEGCSSTAELLQARMLECVRAAESVLSWKARRFGRQPNYHDIISAVLTHVQLDEATASQLIRGLGRTDQAILSIHLANWLLEMQPRTGSSADVLQAALVVAATSLFDPTTALRFYGLRDSYGHPPSLEAANMAITACSHSGRVTQALQILESFPDLGLVPTEYSVIMVITAANYKSRGLYQEAVRAMGCLSRDQAPSLGLMDAVMTVCEVAMAKAATLAEVEAVFLAVQDMGWRLTTRAYNALLRGCAKHGSARMARQYFEQMADKGLPADTGTISALCTAYLRGGEVHRALELYEWLVAGRDVAERIPADIATFNTFIKACHQAGMLEKALEISNWVSRAGVQWDPTTYDELVSTVEISNLWDQKVMRAPEAGAHSFNSARRLWEAAHGASAPGSARELAAAAASQQAHVDQELGLSGHPGRLSMMVSTMQASSTALPSLEASLAEAMMTMPPPEPPPLAVFPEQLRPAPFDALRLMYLDHFTALGQEAALGVTKLEDPTWAARVLTQGAGAPAIAGKATASPCSSVGRSTGTTAPRRLTLTRLPRMPGMPDPLALSPMPSIKPLNLNNLAGNRLTALAKTGGGSKLMSGEAGVGSLGGPRVSDSVGRMSSSVRIGEASPTKSTKDFMEGSLRRSLPHAPSPQRSSPSFTAAHV